jgi:hypothetical protein
MSLKMALPALAAGALLAMGSPAGAQRPIAHAAAACRLSINEEEHLGYTYVYTPITVTNTSCATGKSLARHRGHLRGWRCTRKITSRGVGQYTGRMSCSSGNRRVVYTFAQNT